MLSKADNEFLTRSGKGTPMGDLLRRFWVPALLSAELAERDGPPRKIKVLGDNEWLNLGSPAADPKWGKARGRSWSSNPGKLRPSPV